MNAQEPKLTYRKEYQLPAYLVDAMALKFELYEDHTLVENQLSIHANPAVARSNTPLVLQGEKLELLLIEQDGRRLSPEEYQLTDKELILSSVLQDPFSLRIITKIEPHKNKALQGLYLSRQFYCTQCEPHGFRRITYAMDRPDVTTRFTTRIEADKKKYPCLLSNGNKIEQGDLAGGRHFTVWKDPFRKPSYLFALVAGDLAVLEDYFITKSNRKVLLQIFVEKNNLDQCQHALDSLKQAMRWDEEAFGLEYDLDIYMIVAVSDFNMGAMENKGLNIFNEKYILAKPSTATDLDYRNVQRVVGHEYFHNWTGNRVTLRDWFELSLKEGLTVFREQSFCDDMTSSGIERVASAQIMCTAQFAEDASSLAHPIRPDSYIEIDNFYTVTVYDKGAEVIRMLSLLLGKQGFRLGMDRYFADHDGEAVACDDFITSMEQANNVDLTQFRLWYSQVGTPKIRVKWSYDKSNQTLTLEVEQELSKVLGYDEKQILHFPLVISLLDSNGALLPLKEGNETTLTIRKQKETFVFEQVPENTLPSLLRGFCAPLKVDAPYTHEDLLLLLKHDTDSFVVWDSAQKLYINEIKKLQQLAKTNQPFAVEQSFLEALKTALENKQRDPALTAKIIPVVSMAYAIEFFPEADIQELLSILRYLRKTIAQYLEKSLYEVYSELKTRHTESSLAGPDMAYRALKSVCLHYLGYLDKPTYRNVAAQQFKAAATMTEKLAALEAINDIASKERDTLLATFIEEWSSETLVVDKWFALQARADLPNALEEVQRLTTHTLFDEKTPNKVYSLLLNFVKNNWGGFHRLDGAGYSYIIEKIIKIDQFNPSVASHLAKVFTEWRRYAPKYQELMKKSLKELAKVPSLSNNVRELVVKSLK